MVARRTYAKIDWMCGALGYNRKTCCTHVLGNSVLAKSRNNELVWGYQLNQLPGVFVTLSLGLGWISVILFGQSPQQEVHPDSGNLWEYIRQEAYHT